MCDEKQEQRINLKFLVKLKELRLSDINCCKGPMGIILYLVRMFFSGVSASVWSREKALKMTSARVALSLFPELKRDQYQQIVRADRLMSIRMIVEAVNTDKETVK
ncbi:hypothetical protein TNCV_3482321 [Trichonephila clavipes]|nr:hypothetical protein TNCV_3482321 [Trichonephila clavipes]